MPSFRMHLRARGKVAQVFKMLSDAPQHPVSKTLFCHLLLLQFRFVISVKKSSFDSVRAQFQSFELECFTGV